MKIRQITAMDLIDTWTAELRKLFKTIADGAKDAGWHETYSQKDANEDPFGIGAPVRYFAPILVLNRRVGGQDVEQRVTFEPIHRFFNGTAGRVDIYAYPTLREAMLLRTLNLEESTKLTWDEAEKRVADARWELYSDDRIPLRVDVYNNETLQLFLEDLMV